MNVALFGGTFDPVHSGHLAVARAAQQRFALKRVLFVPAAVPPHKRYSNVTPFSHRYAMLALATLGEKNFIPSLLESPELRGPAPDYTLDTVRRFKKTLSVKDRVFFIIGIDAFTAIATWHEPEALLRECEFIVVSRPGFSLADVANALPESIRPVGGAVAAFEKQPARGDIVLKGATIHLLDNVAANVSATQVRTAVATGRGLARYVPASVAEYIKKFGLYKETSARGKTTAAGHSSGLQVIHGGRIPRSEAR
jgi:nicotinate-nucleotide adenylyltransferase